MPVRPSRFPPSYTFLLLMVVVILVFVGALAILVMESQDESDACGFKGGVLVQGTGNDDVCIDRDAVIP